MTTDVQIIKDISELEYNGHWYLLLDADKANWYVRFNTVTDMYNLICIGYDSEVYYIKETDSETELQNAYQTYGIVIKE